MKKIVVFTGAGISAESGLSTFRDSDGLWEKYSVEEICTHEAWERNPQLLVDFYNARRHDVLKAQPNAAHTAITRLQQTFPATQIITQNVDDLHERAGSSHVIHLHGELMKVTSSRDPNNPRYIQTLSPDHLEVKIGDKAADGSQLRPFIVWFGEPVPEIETAAEYCAKADLMLIIGTSLNVYPAAGLTRLVADGVPIYLIDPKPVQWNSSHPFHHIMQGASAGMEEFLKLLKQA